MMDMISELTVNMVIMTYLNNTFFTSTKPGKNVTTHISGLEFKLKLLVG
jgi:hypothetical protein